LRKLASIKCARAAGVSTCHTRHSVPRESVKCRSPNECTSRCRWERQDAFRIRMRLMLGRTAPRSSTLHVAGMATQSKGKYGSYGSYGLHGFSRLRRCLHAPWRAPKPFQTNQEPCGRQTQTRCGE
jgi:hypothetical protein